MDDGFLFKTTRVVVRKGLIVAFRALVTAGKEQIEEKVPIHVRDIAELTGDYNRRLYSKPCSCDDKRGGSSSTPASWGAHNKSIRRMRFQGRECPFVLCLVILCILSLVRSA